MSEEVKLKACPTPWCDHPEPPYLWQGPTDDYTFICPGCQVEGPYAATEDFAADAWNTRTPSPITEEGVTVAADAVCGAAATKLGVLMTEHHARILARAALEVGL